MHPAEHKAESNAAPISRNAPAAALRGAPAPAYRRPRPALVQGPAIRCLRGQMIGAAEGYVSTAVHAPTSGIVLRRRMPRAVPHPSGLFDLCVVIESDGEDRAVD
jgi:electron transport complex protein RnfC